METLEQIADRVAPNGGKKAAMKLAKARANAAAENAAYEARRALLHDYNDTQVYYRAMVVSFGQDSDEAGRALVELNEAAARLPR